MTTDTEALQEAPPEARPIEIPRVLSVKELGDLMSVSPVEVIKELMKNGVMASINQVIDFDTAAIVAHDMGFEPLEQQLAETAEVSVDRETGKPQIEEDPTKLVSRPPVVTIMGHVDHGKTSLLDAIREAKVAAGESGGITQHIGAYQVDYNGQLITFLDTPGHEAFTQMRARGAQVTDVAVVVVAANDGVMPQTKEAIDHAKAAGVPIVIALNKIDLDDANIDKIKSELSENGVVVEDYGGETPCVPVSARTKVGLDDLLANILVVSEVLDLKANPDRPAIAIVVEAELSKTKGPLATLLVKTGTLRAGDYIVVGETSGRVKAMHDEAGKKLKQAGPSEPAEILGLASVPKAGETAVVVADDKIAKQTVIDRIRQREAADLNAQPHVTLDTLFGEISAGKLKELNIILKTDVQGSIEPIRQSLEKLTNEQVKVKIIHTGSGSVTESDVMLAIASKGIIIAFNTGTEGGAERIGQQEQVDIRRYSVIYNIIEDVDKALKGMLEPTFKEVVTAHAEVRQVFRVARKNSIAGAFVRDGTITRTDSARILRNGAVIADGKIGTLKRFQEDVRDVATNFECGIQIDGFDSFEENDVIEFFRIERDT